MKKVLAVFDGAHFAKGTLDFVCKLNEEEPVLLTGLFLPSVDYTDIMMYYVGGMSGPLYVPTLDSDPDTIAINIEQFKRFCEKNHIEHRVHDVVNGPIPEAIRNETRFSDLMLLSGESFYSNLGPDTQESYLEETIHKAECPVLVLPENYVPPKSIILAYDGSESSVFAIKQFAYVLPGFCRLSTLVAYANPEEHANIPELSGIEELASRHFSDLTFFKLEADARAYFNTWLQDIGNAMLVAGAYGRTGISGLLKQHFLQEIINDHKLPVFIAHK